MPRYLRHINRAKWYRHDGVPWLGPHDIQADALADLYTQDNALSVWLVEDGDVTVDRIVAALAANRSVPTSFDYALIDGSVTTALAIEVQETQTETADATVTALHRDFVRLTTNKLLGLVQAIARGSRERVQPKRVRELIQSGLANGVLDRARIKEDLLARLEVTRGGR